MSDIVRRYLKAQLTPSELEGISKLKESENLLEVQHELLNRYKKSNMVYIIRKLLARKDNG